VDRGEGCTGGVAHDVINIKYIADVTIIQDSKHYSTACSASATANTAAISHVATAAIRCPGERRPCPSVQHRYSCACAVAASRLWAKSCNCSTYPDWLASAADSVSRRLARYDQTTCLPGAPRAGECVAPVDHWRDGDPCRQLRL
jgi:hypothetical protein